MPTTIWPSAAHQGSARVDWPARSGIRPAGTTGPYYQRVPRLFANLALARGDGRYARLQRTLARVQLMILDDSGLEPLDDQTRHDLFEILADRYGRRSTNHHQPTARVSMA
ncbi:ATP-binding protein [Mesorhizobium sp. M0816]|uniref:ATP-binding protein n=1 Tax=Mesorhizobium sp. M0816 TaxID=2957006 RepID=UPI00333B1E02